MNTVSKVICGVIGLLVLVGLFALGGFATATPASGATIAPVNVLDKGVRWTVSGFYVGTTQQFGVNSSGNLTTTGTVTIGTNGSAISGHQFGTCTIRAYANTIAATSTATVDCPVTGVVVGDNISMTAATGSVATYLGLNVIGASASTTAGIITLKLVNNTGGTFTWSAAASSTWFQYRALR